MTQKEAIERMQPALNLLRRGMISIHECECRINGVASDWMREYRCETEEDYDARLIEAKKLKRKIWRMLLDATR